MCEVCLKSWMIFHFLFSLGGKEVFRPGDMVKGNWTLTSEKEFNVKGISTTFQGVAFVKWTETNFSSKTFKEDEFTAHEVYFTETKHFPGTSDSIQPGKHVYPFSFTLPNRPMPSSMEGSKGAIRYFIQIHIRRPIPFPDVTRYKCITVLEEIDINLPKYKAPLVYKEDNKVPKMLGFGNAGTLELCGEIDRRGYCPGEKIALTLVATNKSSQKLGKIKAQIIQYRTFTGNGKEKCIDTTISAVQSDTELEPGKQFSWEDLLIQLEPIPPTIDRPTCQCIRVHYYLEVIVPVPFWTGGDMKLIFPITVGTVPYGKSLGSTQVASQAIKYMQCYKGCESFNQSSSSRSFPQMTYTPMCAYVANYVFHKSPPKAATAAKSTQPSTTVNSSQTRTTTNTTQPRTTTNPSQPKTTTNSSQPRTTTNSSQPRTTTTSSQTKTTSNSTQPRTTTNTTQPRTTTNPSQPKTTTNSSQPRTTTNPSQQRTTTNSSQPRTTSNPSQQRTTSNSSQPKTTTNSPQPKTTTNSPQPKTTTNSSQTKTTLDSTQPRTTTQKTNDQSSQVLPTDRTFPSPSELPLIESNAIYNENTLPPQSTKIACPEQLSHPLATSCVVNPGCSSNNSTVLDKTPVNGQKMSNDVLPTYEEAVGIQHIKMGDNPARGESKQCYMVIRSIKTSLEKLLNIIQTNTKCLQSHGGSFVFKSVKAYGISGNWTKGRVMVVTFSFPSRTQALTWLDMAEIKESDCLNTVDIVITKCKEQFMPDKLLVIISEMSFKEGEEETVERYLKMNDNILKPLRDVHGARLCVSDPDFEVIRGNWRTTERSRLSIMIWPSLQASRNYKESISELQATIDELRKRCMVFHGSRAFDLAANIDD